jgi:hypothetical protein
VPKEAPRSGLRDDRCNPLAAPFLAAQVIRELFNLLGVSTSGTDAGTLGGRGGLVGVKSFRASENGIGAGIAGLANRAL